VYVNAKSEITEQVKIINLSEPSANALNGLESPKEKARVQMQVGMSEALMLRLRRAQDILSQKRQRSVGLEETLAAAIDAFIMKNDPLEKAKRQVIKGKIKTEQVSRTVLKKPASISEFADSKPLNRVPIPAGTRHKLWIKNEGQCSHIDENNQRCQERRFLHMHHKNPVANGGTNELTNLSLLCTGHHNIEHL
jgi:hypothetical protein